MNKEVDFEGKIFVLGCGGVSQCVLPLLQKEFDNTPIVIMDMVDNSKRINLTSNMKYMVNQVTPDNYKDILSTQLSSGDIFVDLAYNISTVELLDWCHKNNVLYINTSVEEWEPYEGAEKKDPTKFTLYHRQMQLKSMVERWQIEKETENNKFNPTAICDHGANPGLVSHFTKQAIIDMVNKWMNDKSQDHDTKRKPLAEALEQKNFAKMAQLLGIKVIHISERDTQITSKPKEPNEFVNTWSVDGFCEEGIAPAELGWGSHEKRLPTGAIEHAEGPKNQILLPTKGMNTLVRSWVPSGPIVGMVIRHGEAYGISDHLTVRNEETGEVEYRPTVHYAYCPSDSAIASMWEYQMNNYAEPEKKRILNDDIISGQDQLGCLLMGHDYGVWWIGSLLDIHEARRLVPNQNATTVQVAISVVAAIKWMIANPQRGVCLPDDVDYEFIMKIAKPYLGPFISRQVTEWNPLDTSQGSKKATQNINTNNFLVFGKDIPSDEDKWQFQTFLLHNETYKL